jgi:hypothetical protein
MAVTKKTANPRRRIAPARKEELNMITRYRLLRNRMDAYTDRAPIRYKVQTAEEMREIRESLKRRGLYYCGNGKFCTVLEN